MSENIFHRGRFIFSFPLDSTLYTPIISSHMAVPNLYDNQGVEFLEFRDALSIHGERWRVCAAMVDGRRHVSFEVPAFYFQGFNSDMTLSRWLAQQARSYADDEANKVQGESYGPR